MKIKNFTVFDECSDECVLCESPLLKYPYTISITAKKGDAKITLQEIKTCGECFTKYNFTIRAAEI